MFFCKFQMIASILPPEIFKGYQMEIGCEVGMFQDNKSVFGWQFLGCFGHSYNRVSIHKKYQKIYDVKPQGCRISPWKNFMVWGFGDSQLLFFPSTLSLGNPVAFQVPRSFWGWSDFCTWGRPEIFFECLKRGPMSSWGSQAASNFDEFCYLPTSLPPWHCWKIADVFEN